MKSVQGRGRAKDSSPWRWDVDFLPGGRELARDLGDRMVVGQGFGFLRPGWAAHETIASILQWSGGGTASPQVIPLWGEERMLLPGVRLKQRPVPQMSTGGVWTDRQTYRAHLDPVKVVVFAPKFANQALEAVLWCDAERMAREVIQVEASGTAVVSLDGLPPGRYRLLMDALEDKAEFVVALPRLERVQIQWIQHYERDVDRQRRVLVFVVQIESLGAPLRGDVGINVIDQSLVPPQPVSGDVFRPDGAGRVAGELPLSGEGPYALEIQSLSDTEINGVFLVPEQGEQIEQGRAEQTLTWTMNPLGQLRSWRWAPGESTHATGFLEEVEEGWRNAPVMFEGQQEGHAKFRVDAPFSQLCVVVLEAATGTSVEHRWEAVASGTDLYVPLSGPFCLLALGGLTDGLPWEGWTALLVEGAHSMLRLHAPERVMPEQPFTIHLALESSGPVPVLVAVREIEDEEFVEPWGPAALLVQRLQQTAKDFAVGPQTKPLWQSVKATPLSQPVPVVSRMPQSSPAGAPPRTGMPSTPPPSGVAPPSSPPPQAGTPPSAGAPPQQKAVTANGGLWRLPLPTQEEFPQVVWWEMLSWEGQRELQIPAVGGQGLFRVDALALDPEAWSYASTTIDVGKPTFAEFVLPVFVHPDDLAIGEVVVLTDRARVGIELHCNGEPVAIREVDAEEVASMWFQGDVVHLEFPLQPGHYQLRVFDESQQILEQVEASCLPWGQGEELRFPIHLLQPGQSLGVTTALVSQGHPGADALEALPGLQPVLLRVGQSLLTHEARTCAELALQCKTLIAMLAYFGEAPEAADWWAVLQQRTDELAALSITGRGFLLNAEGAHDPHWGRETVLLLWEASILPYANLPPQLEALMQRLLQIADEAAPTYQLSRTPDRMKMCREAFRVFFFEDIDSRRKEALWTVQQRLTQENGRWDVQADSRVQARMEAAFAATVLLCSQEPESLHQGWMLASAVLEELGPQGLLYTLWDSHTLLHLLVVCQAGLPQPEAVSAEVQGQIVDGHALMEMSPLSAIQVHAGIVPVGRQQTVPRPLTSFGQHVPWQVFLFQKGGSEPVHEVEVGDRLQLVVQLRQDAQPGDQVEVYLPPALAWLEGTAETKLLSLPFEDGKSLVLSLAATSTTTNYNGEIVPQHWGVRLCNTMREERGNAAFDRTVIVWPAGTKRRKANRGWMGNFRKIFG